MNPRWNANRRSNHQSGGYVTVFVGAQHPMADNRGWCLEHRLVMASAIGRTLDEVEVVHHINGVKDDNRLANLQLLASQSEHASLHGQEMKS